MLQEEPIFFEAPTGFGKTGVTLQYALEHLQSGTYEKIFCLTGKSTGQNQLIEQLRAMQNQHSPRCFQLRSRAEHAIRSRLHTCNGRKCRRDVETQWQQSSLSPALLFGNGIPALEEIRTLGTETGLCPYEISRALIPLADVLVGDFNYVFSPRHNSLLLEMEGLQLNRVLLMVDEAHNLPARVNEAFSSKTSLQEAQTLLDGLTDCRAPTKTRIVAEMWGKLLQDIEPVAEIPLHLLYELEDLLKDLLEQTLYMPLDWEALPENAYEILRNLLHTRTLLENSNLPMLAWSKRHGELRFSCLDASHEIGNTIKQFGGSLLMSATLSPMEQFAKCCGQNLVSSSLVQAETPWRKKAYRLAIDLRVDTRLKLRTLHYTTTADTICRLADSAEDCVVAYFPSYEYAEGINETLLNFDSAPTVFLQPRGLCLAKQNEFLSNALNSAKVLLLIMGGSFAEGIDVLGGHVSHALIVGPSLPVADNVQRARMARLENLDSEAAYHLVCREPAITRILQAVGRMVRRPGQKATILFHCQRFAESHYQGLFSETTPEYIRTEEGMARWRRTL